MTVCGFYSISPFGLQDFGFKGCSGFRVQLLSYGLLLLVGFRGLGVSGTGYGFRV